MYKYNSRAHIHTHTEREYLTVIECSIHSCKDIGRHTILEYRNTVVSIFAKKYVQRDTFKILV